jgi:hypothetical protein
MQQLEGKRMEGLKGRRHGGILLEDKEREGNTISTRRVCSPVPDSLTYIPLPVLEHHE